MNNKTIFNFRNLWLLVLLIGAVLVPYFFRGNQYAMVLVTTVLIYAVLSSAWNIIGGMAGQLDLAAGAYLGLGAFTTGAMMIRWNITPWIGAVVGGLVAMGISYLIGLPLFRFKVRELWYALSSSAMVEVFRVLFLTWDSVGGPTERYLPSSAQGSPWMSLRFNTYTPYFYIMLAVLVIVLFINHRIRNSKLGYSLLALNEDEDAAEVLGVNARTSKLKALVTYAFIVGFTGGIYACMYGYIHPSFFDTSLSMEVAILGIVGGLGITFGPVMAAIFLVSFREYMRASLGGGLVGIYLVVYAIVLILVALYQPRGIAPLVQKLFVKLKLLSGGKKDATIPANPES
jgi:branched-chain amino acid transport system permease protein